MLIRYYGHLGQRTGYGVAATQMCLALSKQEDVRLEICPDFERWDIDHVPKALRGAITDANHTTPNPDAVIVHTLPGDCHKVLAASPLIAPCVKVAYTTWEGTSCPDSVKLALDGFDQVWVPSDVTKLALWSGRRWQKPKIVVIPHTYDPSARGVYERKVDGLLGRTYRLYWIGAWMARKNPMGLLRAYLAEFTSEDDVELYLHSVGTPPVLFQLALASAGIDEKPAAGSSEPGRPRVLFSNENLSDEAVARLHQDGDCFVTATRGEAWNLPAFDAMLAGRHIISPDGLGSDEFLNDTSVNYIDSSPTHSYLDARVVSPPAGAQPGAIAIATFGGSGMTSRVRWREPNLIDLSYAMRQAYDHRQRTINRHYDPAVKFGHYPVGQMAINALREG